MTRENKGVGFLDHVGRTVAQGIDRAKFEAEKFQRTTRIQGELNDMKRLLDSKMIDLGQRAYDLYRAGQITSHSVGELVKVVDELRSSLVVKEEQLKEVQAEVHIEPDAPPPAVPPAQSVPIETSQTPPATPHQPPATPYQPPAAPPPASSTPQQAPPQPSQGTSASPPPPQPATPQHSPNTSKLCPVCGFQMSIRAIFCPNCGYRVST